MKSVLFFSKFSHKHCKRKYKQVFLDYIFSHFNPVVIINQENWDIYIILRAAIIWRCHVKNYMWQIENKLSVGNIDSTLPFLQDYSHTWNNSRVSMLLDILDMHTNMSKSSVSNIYQNSCCRTLGSSILTKYFTTLRNYLSHLLAKLLCKLGIHVLMIQSSIVFPP